VSTKTGPPHPPYTTPGGTILSFISPPTATRRTIGLSIVDQAFNVNTAVVNGGPNSGYQFVTGVTNVGPFTTVYNWVLHQDLENTNSDFYKHQCGNYNAQTNPNGFIDGPTLIAGVSRHESGSMNSHYAEYKAAQDSPSNNLGVVGEKQIGLPSESSTQFGDRISQTLVSKATAIKDATSPEPCDGTYNATCTMFNGFVNLLNPDVYQPCQPQITSLSVTSGPVGTPVTINGLSFGAQQGNSTVSFNGVSAGTATSWSNTSINVNVPSGATTGPVVVVVASQQSNSITFTVQ